MGHAAPLNRPVVVTGASGMLGRAVTALLRAHGVAHAPLTRRELDLTDAASIARAVPEGAAAVINCAAYTDVDGAETDYDTAHAVNASGVDALGARCRRLGATVVHFSTDYVFDGGAAAPYAIDHPKRPINAYGRSKSEGEDLLRDSGAECLILRTSWLYAPWGKNFVRTIARLGAEKPTLRVVNDQRGRPTSAERLAATALDMLGAGVRGVHHATDAGECTWHEFAREIVRALGLPARVDPCTSEEFPRPAARPAYSVLDISTTESIIGPRAHWRDALAEALTRLEPTP